MKAIAHPSMIGIRRSHAAPHFHDRVDAGIQLGRRLTAYRGQHVLVLGIARGGVPVAAEVARVTDGELNVMVARKLRAPISAPPPPIAGRVVILVDDGLATGATMIAAARSVRAHKPARLVIAVPVGSAEAYAALKHEADEVVCLATPEPFWAVGAYYDDFGQTEDDEVERMLRDARQPQPVAAPPVARVPNDGGIRAPTP